MAKSIELSIKPDLLRWARETLNESIESVAGSLKVSTDDVKSWEEGTRRIRLTQLERLSKIYKRPLAVFFLPNVPKSQEPPRDFRTLDGITSPTFSSPTLLVIRSSERELEIATMLGAKPTSIQLKATQSDDPKQLAEDFRSQMGITPSAQIRWRNSHTALLNIRRSFEDKGVFVMQGKMPFREARGFSLMRENVWGIVLNAADSESGKLFTIFHEACHLLLRMPGICVPRFKHSSGVEAFCNQFAADCLVPMDTLLSHAEVISHNSFTWEEEDLKKIAADFGVSREVILRRLLTSGRTTDGFYVKKRKEWRQEWEISERNKKEKTSGGAVPPAVMAIRNFGPSFVRLVLANYDRHRITAADVTDFLRIRTKHFGELESRVTI